VSLFSSFNISASALTANRLRMDVVASNIANAQTTRAEYVNGQWQPYRRKVVELQAENQSRFNQILQAKRGKETTGGVVVSAVRSDPSPFKLVYDPYHPDANEEGYVQLPNVDMVKEMVDLMSASRSYEANVTVLNGVKQMYLKALEIGK
jgi:flagellar basal-body rod protein FlgC